MTAAGSATGADDAPGVPAGAGLVFGARLELALGYVAALRGPGIERGLIGPREAPRLWDRHVLHCAALQTLLPPGAHVVDIGSGAGLPGIPIAIARPDLRVDLVEPLQRRSEFLTEVVAELGLGASVRVVRGRAEDSAVVAELGPTHWVTARAVAPLDRLVRWCLPLLAPGGHLLAIKGRTAQDELATSAVAVSRAGGQVSEVLTARGVDGSTLTVVSIRRGAAVIETERDDRVRRPGTKSQPRGRFT